MFRKLFVVVISILALCPQANASTYTFTTPPAGKIWLYTDTVAASGSTNVPAGDKLIVSFCRVAGGVEIKENKVTHTVIGTVSGPNTWTASMTAPPVTCIFILWCGGGWELSPITSGIMNKNHFVKVEHVNPINGNAYRMDQGVKK